MGQTIWVCEAGAYEQAATFGAWRSLASAVAGVKRIYGAPYIVRWEADPTMAAADKVLTGHFEAVPNYSTRHTDYFQFTTMELEDEPA